MIKKQLFHIKNTTVILLQTQLQSIFFFYIKDVIEQND